MSNYEIFEFIAMMLCLIEKFTFFFKHLEDVFNIQR